MRLCTTMAALLLLMGHASLLGAQEPEVRLVRDKEAGELVVVIGPVDLPAGTRALAELRPTAGHGGHGGHGGAIFSPVTTVTVRAGGYLYGFGYELVDRNGRVLPPELLHHLNIINPDNRELFLPISQRVLAVGRETGSHDMPWLLFGYPVPSGMPMVVVAMLHNPTEQSFVGVEVRVRLKYVAAGRPWPLFEVYPFQLDVAFPAGDKYLDLPPGRSEYSYEASPALEGRVMVIGGHLHEYALSLSFEDVTANEVLWTGYPVEDDNGQLVGVTLGRLYRKLGVKVSPDHVYRVTVAYDNPTGDTLYAGGMGVIGGLFMPSTGRMWPRADTTDPLYALDRQHYMREVRGRYEEIASGAGAAATEEHHR